MGPRVARQHDGYAMVALLVGLSIMAVALSVALPSWSALAKREREEELIFRGEQYARAIMLYQRRFANAFPPNLDQLVEQKFLRRKYKDPMSADGEFQPILVGQPIPGQASPVDQAAGRDARGGIDEVARGRGAAPPRTQGVQVGRGTVGPTGGIMGVVSKSTGDSMRVYNGRRKYSEWAFIATQAVTAAGPGDGGRQGGPRQGGPRQGGPGGRGAAPTAPGGLRRGGRGF